MHTYTDLGLSYQPVPKVACTSIKTALVRAAGVPYCESEDVHSVVPTIYDVEVLGGNVYRRLAVETGSCFAFVRNPFDRLVSCYINKVQDRDTGLGPAFRGIDFPAFIREAVSRNPATANVHLRPQHLLLGAQQYAFIGRFENLRKDWLRVCDLFSIQIELPHRKKSKNDGDYRPWYDSGLRGIVEAYYRKDLDCFAYQF